MRRSYSASVMAGFFGLLLFGVADPASAQPLNKLPPARAPCSVLSGQPCHPSFCEVFHLGPCFPQYLPPIGQDLRLTIVSTDETDPANGAAAETATSDQGTASEQDTTDAAEERPLDSIRAMYAALAPAGCRRLRIRRATAWSTPSALLSNATAQSWRRRA